jgi:hypothetical protein
LRSPSVFTKHTLLAFPAAVAVQLLLSSKKNFAIWLAGSVGACLLLLLLVLGFDGHYFLDHLMLPRVYYWERLFYFGFHVLNFQVPIFVALVWAFRTTFGAASVLVWGFGLSHLMGAAYSGGEGAGTNHYFDAMIATAMIVGLALPGIERLTEGARFQRTLFAILLTVPFFVSSLAFLPTRIASDLAESASQAQLASEFSSAASFMRSRPGAAFCEDMMICYDAGKPFVYDPFAADQLVKTGRLREDDVLRLLDARQFGVIELGSVTVETTQPTDRDRFPLPFRQKLQANYRLAYRTSKFVFFTPKAG